MSLKKHLQKLLTEAAENAGFAPQAVIVTSSKDEQHGDVSSNLPLTLAKAAGKPPMDIAEAVISHCKKDENIIADILL